MNLFKRKPVQPKNTFMTDQPVEQFLFADWYVDMANAQDYVENGDSAQLVDYDSPMTVYGSALSNPADKSEKSVTIDKTEKSDDGSLNTYATIRHPGHILFMVVTYGNESQRSAAEAIINSARYKGK
jgi:hypothetical protein